MEETIDNLNFRVVFSLLPLGEGPGMRGEAKQRNRPSPQPSPKREREQLANL